MSLLALYLRSIEFKLLKKKLSLKLKLHVVFSRFPGFNWLNTKCNFQTFIPGLMNGMHSCVKSIKHSFEIRKLTLITYNNLNYLRGTSNDIFAFSIVFSTSVSFKR